MVKHACDPSILEVKVGGFWSEAGQGKSERPYLRNKVIAKGLEVWLKW
jgi:hypothetical protein